VTRPEDRPARTFPTAQGLLGVRPMQAEEADLVVRYFHDASDADLERMGVVPRPRLPPPHEWAARLGASLQASPPQASFYLTWLVDGQAIGFSSLKDLRPGDSADLHLHMWSAPHRGHGHGAILFCLSVLEAYDRFGLRRAVCEPKASNPMPNRMLAKVGFPLVRTYEGASSELSQTTLLNRYDVPRAVAEAYLRERSPGGRNPNSQARLRQGP
jgi:RimJ/RimL family protein N-acetyltransferase